MMVICYLEKKSFIDINFIFTVCANLQYISNHLSVTVEDCSLRSAATHFILCGGVLSLFYELSDRLDPSPGHQADQEGRPAQLVRDVDQALALPAHPLDSFLVPRGGGLV